MVSFRRESIMKFIMPVIFLMISIFLLMGKGSFLIAGYNTASADEKAKYNEKKLCRIVGLGFFIITCGLFSLMMLETYGLYVMIGLFIIGMAIILIGSQYASLEHNTKKMKSSMIISILLTIVIGGFVIVVMFIGDIHIQYHDNSIQLSGTLVSSSEISYAAITEVEFRENIDIGHKKNGINNAVIEAGRYRNDEFDDYRLYGYTNSLQYVIIYTDSEIFVVSGKNKQQTQDIYEKLKEEINVV